MEYFYSHIAENDLNRDFIDALRNYAEEVKEQIYLLQHPLTDSKYSYEVHDVGIVLMRKHKIAFVSFKKDNKDQFEDYKTDVLEDINSLSDTYGYRNLVGRVRKWENEITISCFLDKIDDYIKWIKRLELHDENQYRRLELIITLFIGSINDVSNLSLEKSTSIIERVKQKIQVFDGEQTRFIYGDINSISKPFLMMDICKNSRAFLFISHNKYFCVSYPLNIKQDGGNVKIYSTEENVEVTNQVISECIGIISSLATNGNFIDAWMNDDGSNTQASLDILELLLHTEPSYLRYDYDPITAKGKEARHPIHHLDINMSRKGKYKLGLYEHLSPKDFVDIVSEDKDCHFLSKYVACIPKRTQKKKGRNLKKKR